MAYDKERYLDLLQRYWGYADFRGIQSQIIESIANGRDTLGLMPTGGGKSITFQVPAMAMPGVCIVITPLIALMKDQVQNLRRRGIIAASIYSGMTRNEIVTTLENCILGRTKILYVSPERLSSELFKVKLSHMTVSFITVDEAHCISQWGYDFRPSYLHISDIRHLKPNAPVLALTATATTEVIGDIQKRLAFRQENVFRMSFERKNLAYVVRQTSDKLGEMQHILNAVAGSAIVYVRSRKRSAELSKAFTEMGISSTFYHAGLEHSTKDERQKAWTHDEVRVMVATNAFGMGIDKPDVRLVLHADCPSSLEAYFQEAGRAGRDGEKAYAVLLYNGSDERKLKKRVSEEFPDKEFVVTVYNELAYFYQIGVGSGLGYTFAFDIDKFCVAYKHFPVQVNSALKILSRAGYIAYDPDPDNAARLHFLLERDQFYRLDSLSDTEDAVIQALLRNYGGLFADYGYIDEGVVARAAGLDQMQTYQVLKSLRSRRILDFIPRSTTPLITYLRDREEERFVVISSEVYEQRKSQYARRIKTVIDYAENGNVCRSRQLLRYFDETRSDECGQCDICLGHNHRHSTLAAQNAIRTLLSDHKEHHVSELRSLPFPKEVIGEAVEWLIHEEIIFIEGSIITS